MVIMESDFNINEFKVYKLKTPPAKYEPNGVYFIENDSDSFDIVITSNTAIPTIFTTGNSGNSDLFSDDFIMSIEDGSSFGKYTNGDLVPAKGLSAKDVILMASVDILVPSFINPSLTHSSNVTGTREVGESLAITITLYFNRGEIRGDVINGVWDSNSIQNPRAGIVTNYIFESQDNGTTDSKVLNTVVSEGDNTFECYAYYNEGPQPYDSYGNDYDYPYPMGYVVTTVIFKGAYKRFYGVNDNLTNPRSLNFIYDNVPINNTFDLLTGTSEKTFHIYLPEGTILDKVESVEASNADITSQYISQGVVQIPDAGGVNVNYNYYKMTTDQPYSTSNTHKIKVKNG